MSLDKYLGVGSRVKHPAFGDGVIIESDVAAYRVCFMQFGLKLVGKDYSSWEIIEKIEPEEAVSYIDEIFEQIFKMELASWHEDEALWPKDLSLKAFWELFDVEIHATLIDTVDEELVNSLALSEG